CALTLLVLASSLAAQQTAGKIEGTVTDDKGAPVASAQVTIVGTSFGALTDNKGYYFINNVPVGTYTVRTKFIGYTAAEVPGVRVQGGFTLTVNVKLIPSAVAIGPVTVEAAANPIVPRDKVTSGSTVGGDLVASLPVDDVRQVIQLTPGVVETDRAAGVSIRGGRPGEANVYIDGAPVRATNSGSQRVVVATNALEEASVTTGALGVEFSDAQSGIVSYTTRAGGQKLAGSLSTETDEPFGDAIRVGFNRFEGSLGGPIPNVSNLTWFASGLVQGVKSAGDVLAGGGIRTPRGMDAENVPVFVTAGVDAVVPDTQDDGTVQTVVLPRYVQFSGQCGQLGNTNTTLGQSIRNNYGYECQGNRRPMDWQTRIQGSGKLQYTYGTGSSVSLTGVVNGQQDRFTPGRDLGNPALYRGQHLWSRLAVLNLNHQVTRTAERALSVNLNLSWGRDRALVAPLAPQSELETRDPTLGITFKTLEFTGIDQMPFPITEDIVRNVRNNSGLRSPYLNRSDLLEGETKRLNPYGLAANQWVTGGLETRVTSLSETRYIGRLVVDWQANRFHRFTLGGDAKKTNLAFYDSPMVDQFFQDVYVAKPVQYGLFAADRLDLGDVVLELGVRWDYYDSKYLFSGTPGVTFSAPGWNAIDIADPDPAISDTAYANSLARVFTPSTGHKALSPRIRVAFPVTERTGFRLSYAQQVQTPDFGTLLSGTNNDIPSGNTNQNDAFGRDVNWGKTILFEFGVRHAFSQDVVLDVAAYNKDKVSDLAYRTVRFVNPTDVTDTIQPNILTNRDFGNSRGVDIRFDRRWGNHLNASVAYTFQVSKGTGSDPSTYLNTFARQVSALSGDRTPPPEQAQRTNNDRTHSVVGTVALTVPSDWKSGTAVGSVFRDVGAFLTFRVLSGLPYTRIINQGDGQTVPFLAFGLGGRTEEGEALNGAVTPWTRYLDLRINKGVRIGRLDITAYADIRNLFNFRNTERLFAETGDVVNVKHEQNEVGDPALGTGEYQALWNEAQEAGVLEGRSTVNLTGACSTWDEPLSCESLKRVEQRFGDGNGMFTEAEQVRAWRTYYNATFGSWRMYGDPRRVRVGFEVNF
ncbi:MAG TPA: TonB-dependent receptor, partial [Gemmatimonadales bacterium]|nr:TonB-dependent receptor [Gemmatimonadales bacterium]